MILAIARWEFLRNVMNLRFPFSSVMLLTMMLSTTWVRIQDYEQRQESYRMAEKMQEESLVTMNLNTANYSPYRPPPRLSVLFRGTEGVNEYGGEEDAATQANPIDYLFSRLDIGWILGAVGALIALLFAYDSISGEGEQGTLRLLLSYSVPRYAVIIGKWLGGCVVLFAACLIAFVANMLLLVSSGSVQIGTGEWIALGCIMAVTACYLSLFYLIGVGGSLVTRSSSSSVLLLLGVWALLVFVIPNASPYIGSFFSNSPSPRSMRERQEEAEQMWRDDWMEARDTHIAAGDMEGMKRSFVGEDGAFRKGLLNLVERKFEIVSEHERQCQPEINLSMLISRISPFAGFVYAANDLSATGPVALTDFADAQKKFTRAFLRWYGERIAEVDRRPIHELDKAFNETLDVSALPRFKYREISVSERLRATGTDLVMLFTYSALFLVLNLVGFLRRDIV